MEKKIFLQQIHDNFPRIRFNQARLITAGYDSNVIVLDEKIVFSFPKPKYDCLEKMQRQIRIVPLLNKEITLRIPNFKYIPENKLFAGYQYVAGAPLSNKIIKGLSPKQREACAKQVANFINELQAFSVPVAKKSGVKMDGSVKNKKIQPVLVHQDLIDEHILFDLKKKKIVGVIDFGDITLADPALEFSRLWRYGESFLDLILKHYRTKDKEIKARSRRLWLASRKG